MQFKPPSEDIACFISNLQSQNLVSVREVKRSHLSMASLTFAGRKLVARLQKENRICAEALTKLPK
eukprot:m.125823 g.125823  ORF g.125823 m.125823 type:complete len:66 (-) comp9696_c0_seq1:122-319(-)